MDPITLTSTEFRAEMNGILDEELVLHPDRVFTITRHRSRAAMVFSPELGDEALAALATVRAMPGGTGLGERPRLRETEDSGE